MQKKQVKKLPIRKKIYVTLFVLSWIFIMISLSYSWFMNGSVASVSGIQIHTAEGDPLSLQIGDKIGGTLEFECSSEYELQARCGNGLYFYDAIMEFGDTVEIGKDGSYIKKKEVVDFIQVLSPDADCQTMEKNGVFAVDFMVHSGTNSDLFLYPLGMNDQPSGITPAGEEQSPYGDGTNCNTGYICGAMRIALLQKQGENGPYKLTLVWAPATDVQLCQDDDSKLYYIISDPDAVAYEEEYLYYGQTKDTVVTVDTAATRSGSVTEDNVVYAWGELSRKLPIGTLSENGENTFRLVIWVDGNDRECHNALLQGNIQVALHFGL